MTLRRFKGVVPVAGSVAPCAAPPLRPQPIKSRSLTTEPGGSR